MFVLLLFNLRTCSALVLIVPPENSFRVIEERKTNESVCLVWKHDVRGKKKFKLCTRARENRQKLSEQNYFCLLTVRWLAFTPDVAKISQTSPNQMFVVR